MQSDEAKNLGAEPPEGDNSVATGASPQKSPDAAGDDREDPFQFFTEWNSPADEEAFKDL